MSMEGYITGNDLLDVLLKFKPGILNLFANKEDILDKLSLDDSNNLLFDGSPIKTDNGNSQSNVSFEDFDINKAYSVNDYVIYNNSLYKCKEDIPAGNFNEKNWDSILIGNYSELGEFQW